MDHISSGRVWHNDLSEAVDMPMPLRIIKKKDHRKEDHEIADDHRKPSSSSLKPSPTVPNLLAVPIRRSSLPRPHTMIGMSRENAPWLGRARQSDPMQSLHVPKHRNTTAMSPPTSDTLADRRPADDGGAVPPPTGERVDGQQTRTETAVTPRVERTPHRASTTGSVLFPGRFSHGPLFSSSRAPPLVGRSQSLRQVKSKPEVPKTTPEHDDDDDDGHGHGQSTTKAKLIGIGRRFSLKGGFMSRAMNVFTSRLDSASHSASIGHDGRTKEDKETTSREGDEIAKKQSRDEPSPKNRRVESASKHLDEASRTLSGQQSTFLHGNSTMSSGLDSSSSITGSMLDNTLSEFPIPPSNTPNRSSTITSSRLPLNTITSPIHPSTTSTSSNPSATITPRTPYPSTIIPSSSYPPITSSSSSSPPPTTTKTTSTTSTTSRQTRANMAEYRDSAIVGAELSAVAETRFLGSDEDGRSVLVAVEIKGILNRAEEGRGPRQQGLAVVVVIDNS